MKLRMKLLGLLLIPLLALGAISTYSIKTMATLTADKKELIDGNVLILNADRDMYQANIAVHNILLSPKGSKEYDNYLKSYNENVQQATERVDTVIGVARRYEAVLKNVKHEESGKSLFDEYSEFQNDFKSWKDQSSKFVASAQADSLAQSQTEFVTMDRAFTTARSHVNNMGEILGAIAEARVQSDEALLASSTTKLIMAAVAAVVVCGLLGVLLTERITRPIVEIARIAREVAGKNLAVQKVKVTGTNDEVGQLALAVNSMLDTLRGIVRTVHTTAESLASSAEEFSASAMQHSKTTESIAHTIQEIAIGSEKQFSSVNSSSKRIDLMSAEVEQIAVKTETVANVSRVTSELAVSGNTAIQTAISQMSSINKTIDHLAGVVQGLGDRSQEIGQIVETITMIANQTNLLALNAAIESARAGEHGRGFSVVADEVRKLAVQSANSAQQISELIVAIQQETSRAAQFMESGQREVKNGIGVVNDAGAVFERIRHSVTDVAEQIQDVSETSQHMSTGTAHVVQAIDLIAQVAESNAYGTSNVSASAQEQLASMEEITLSAAALAQVAEELQETIREFKV